MKNLKKQVILSLIVLLGFSSLVANAEEAVENALPIPSEVGTKVLVEEVKTDLVLPVCDHNGDEKRDLIDVQKLAEIKGTFSLEDLQEYAANNQDDKWCEVKYWATSKVEEVKTEPILAICDHNGDEKRDLIDVSMFAKCQNTFDANGDGIHDLADVAEYAANNHRDDGWCEEDSKMLEKFECEVTPKSVFKSEKSIENALPVPIKKPAPVLIEEIEEKSAPYVQSCSVIFGAMKDFYNPDSNVAGEYNSVIDLYKDNNNVINLSDVGMMSQMYYAGDVTGCNAQINNFQENVGWCGGLEQSLIDSPESIDLADLASVSSLINARNQNDCYTYLYPGTVVEEPEEAPKAAASSGTAFVIKDIETVVSCESFDISWRTTKNSDTILDFGIESGVYTENIDNEFNARDHSLELTDLLANTTYYYQVRAISSNGREITATEKSFTTTQCEVLGEKIEAEPKPQVLGVKESNVCTYVTPDVDILGQTEWADGSLLRGCGSEIYIIENQEKRHIKSLSELFNYIGQRIYNVKDSVLNLF